MRTVHVGRWVFDDDGLHSGYLRVREDTVEEVCLGDPPPDSVRALVLPSFVNAHTHIGDSFAYPAPRGTVEDIVAPPHGFKHRALRSTPAENKIAAMRDAAMQMAKTGTSAFVDFREEGLEGVRELARAVAECPVKPVILGRPALLEAVSDEASGILEEGDGFGLSAARDTRMEVLRQLSSLARGRRKAFAMHASECVREDIDSILDLKPSFLVHMTAATEADLEHCAEEKVPIVVCPRSNEFFGIDPRIPQLLSIEVPVALGTDNGMIARPDLLEEMKAAYRLSRPSGRLSPSDVVRLATSGGRKVLNATGKILTNSASDSDFVVIKMSGDDPLLEIVTASRSEDICAVIRGGKVWRAENCWT